MILTLIAFVLFALIVTLFIIFIIKRDRGHREPIGALFIAMGFGVLAVVIAAVAEHFLLPKSFTETIRATSGQVVPWSGLVFGTLMIGLIEEGAKCIPLALFIYKKRYFDELTDGIIYFGITALTFGILENMVYTSSFGGAVGVTRALFMPYLHAGFTVLFGVALAYRKVLKKSWWLVIAGFSTAILAHAAYDFMVMSRSLWGVLFVFLISIFLNIMLFVLFWKAQKGDEARGQSTIGANKFCKHCGKPNPKHNLHCEYCGKVA